MGAISIVREAQGTSMKDAFNSLVAEAKEEHGTDSYNGEINNCDLGIDYTHKRGDFKHDEEFIGWLIDQSEKRLVHGYCKKKPIANTNKIKTVVTNYPQKGARKFETRYLVKNAWPDEVLYSAKTQIEAIKWARQKVEKNPHMTCEIEVIKQLVNGNAICAKIDYKKSTKERLGTYVFAGWAPY